LDPSAPPAVEATWCFVPVKVAVLSAAAAACAESGHVFVRRGGEPEPFGTLVRHWDLASRLDQGSDAAVAAVAGRLDLLEVEDRCGLAVAGSWRLVAEIISEFGFAVVEWAQGSGVAIATGTDPVLAARRAPVFAALNATKATVTADELEAWDRHAVASGVDVVVLAVRAGYGVSEVTAELLADRATLAAAAALNDGGRP
jgi:hypothetical protein